MKQTTISAGKGKAQDGMALLVALIAIIMILAAVALVMGSVFNAKRGTDRSVNQAQLEELCKAGIDIGIERIWHQYLVSNGNTTGNLASYRVFIDDLLPCDEDADGDGIPDMASEPLVVVDPSEPRLFGPDDLPEEVRPQVTDVTISRRDDANGILLTLMSAAQTGSETAGAAQTIRISGEPFSGYAYAVLAKNINCILCHAGFRALDLESNSDPDLYGTFDRIKIATLESLLFRRTSADSKLAGTVYTRGEVYNSEGTLMSADQLAGGDFKGHDFDRTNGKILQNEGTGEMSTVSLVDAIVDDDGKPEQFANLYKNYPTNPELMTDGNVPDTFPAPYPDNNGDRYVAADEFDEVANSLQGVVTGGIAYGVPDGEFYDGEALPTESNDAMALLSSTGRYDGNVMLVGTDDNPIVVNGEVAVDGDLLIKGKIKGWGQFFVGGNSYLMGDITYADAEGQFGEAADGTKNGLALVSGGSILMGDYLTIRGKSHTADFSKYPDKSASIDCRQAHKSRSKTINRDTQILDYGYFDPGVIDAGEIQLTMFDDEGNEVPRQGQQFSFTNSELMLFNKLEADKAAADPSYRPRFYGLRDSQPDNIYVYNKNMEEHAVHYTETGGGVKSLAEYLIEKGYSLDIIDNAAYHYMNPAGNWISEDQLRQIWWNDEQQRSMGDKWLFDGLLYSNNAIFAITRSYVRHKSNTEGKMRIRGAIICPDLGVLTPGPDQRGNESLSLYYDRRVQRFWAPQDTTQVVLQRVVYLPVA